MDERKVEEAAASGGGGGGEAEGGAGLWIDSTALTGLGWAGETSATLPCHRHSRTRQGGNIDTEETPSSQECRRNYGGERRGQKNNLTLSRKFTVPLLSG